MPATIHYDHEQRTRVPSDLTWLAFVGLAAMALWASQASLDEIVRGPGKVVPISQTQVIQSLEGGILSSMPVWEGKQVSAGEVVATLSDSQFKGAYEELESQSLALEARMLRLNSEMTHAETLSLPDKICSKASDVCQSEQHFFESSKREFFSSVESFQGAIDLQMQEVSMIRKMASNNILPKLDLVKAEQALNARSAEMSDYLSEYQTIRSREYAESLAELKQVKAQLSVRADQLVRTELKAPTKGIVNKILITTIGGVAPPSEPILELTPLDDELRIEAKISPSDVAFIHPGMRSTIKLTAYDYTIYGSLSGEVTHVSADTFIDETNRDADPYYKVFIEVDKNASKALKKDIETRPGMLADVELHTGSKTVLQYLLKPLFKSKEAFRER